MFDQNDIEALQERINVIWASASSADIILMGRERVDLREVSSDLPLNRCTLLILYNRYKGRVWSGGIVGLVEVAAAVSFSKEDVQVVTDIINADEYLLSQVDGDISSAIESLTNEDMILDAETPMTVSTYVSSLHSDIGSIYMRLKGMMNITGHILTIKAIIGGMYFGLLGTFSEEDIKERLYKLEDKASLRHIDRDKIQDYIEWYEAKSKETLTVPPEGKTATRVDQVGFYEESFSRLDKIEEDSLKGDTPASVIYRDIQVFTPQIKTERYTIHPPLDIDVIDLISSATTSRDMPLIAADIEGRKIIKKYNSETVDPAWFTDIDLNTMKIYVRTSKTKKKYQLVRYFVEDNYFLLESQSKLLPVDEIVTILCSHLDVYWITRPESYSSTYSSITNRVNMDRDVLAWLVTNPPGEYANTGIGQYVFVKEESKPNALKDKTNIHIQLGEDKMYLSTSQAKTTSGTLVPQFGRRWVGFERGQEFFNISINRTPGIAYANLCVNIYKHVIAMYFKYYRSARSEIDRMARQIPMNPPLLNRLVEREPTLEEQYSSTDPDLYKYTSSSASGTLLPVPIERSDASMWRNEGYTVMKLPTTILNYPFIEIATSEDIWVRTPKPGKFILVQKSNNDYIPILYTGKGFGILLNVTESGVVTGEVQEIASTQRVLGEASSTFGKIGRLVGVPESLSMFLRPISITGVTTYRMGVTPNILVNLNEITRMSKSPEDVAVYSYLCKQENWTQEVDEIREDIVAQRIDPFRHFRALEQTFHLNLYYIREDMIEPRLIKPPHSMFYLHRRGNPNWESVLFYYMEEEKTLVIRRDNRSNRIISTFKGASSYLDRVMDETNVIRMISPKADTDTVLQYQTPPFKIEGWSMYEQVVDDYGKVRGITYRNKKKMATMDVGFSPLVSPEGGTVIPIGRVVSPTMRGRIPDIVSDIRWMEREYLLHPEARGGFEGWKKRERDARVLRAVTLLLYSHSGITADEFVDELMVVDEDVSYDTTSLTNSLPSEGKSDPWEYFLSSLGGTMVNEEKHLVVPSVETREALRMYITAIPKVKWPRSFPHYVVYSWDIRSSESESVFLSQESVLSIVMMDSYPVETDQLTISPTAYVLRQGNERYLVQMGRDIDHILHIAYEWINNRRNVGYSSVTYVDDDDLPNIQEVTSTTPRVESISYIMFDTHPFLIIPL